MLKQLRNTSLNQCYIVKNLLWSKYLNPHVSRSTTYTLPEESSAILVGSSNCPSPEPVVPHLVINFPLASNFCMRLLPSSTTKTFPDASTARPAGLVNCPSPEPVVPHLVINFPLLSNFVCGCYPSLLHRYYPMSQEQS